MAKMKNPLKKRNVKAFLSMMLGTSIYCFAIVWILDLGEFYAGGITGISQLLTVIFGKYGIPISKSIFIALFNLPLLIIGWQGVSRRFAVFSICSVLIQVGLIFLLEQIGFSPFQGLADQKLLLAIMGGLLTGVGCGICLRGGASSGGMDILSQYISLRKNISFAKISLSVDFLIICAGGLVANNINVAVFTIVRLLIHIIALDKIHTIYKYVQITIVTTKKEEIRQALIAGFNHGITIYEVIGGYTNQEKWVLQSVVSSYEIEEYSNIAKKIDPQVFISYSSVNGIVGFFNRNVIT